MTALLIDTAFESCQVGLWDNDVCITMASVPGGGKHDVVLAPLVDEMLKVHGVKIKDLAEIIVTTGPGRFTGLRVGIAFARGLALVYKTPLKGVLTTEALAWEMRRGNATGPMAVIVTVKRGESFIQRIMPENKGGKSGIERVMDADLAQYFAKDNGIKLAGVMTPEVQEIVKTLSHIQVMENITEPSLKAIKAVAATLAQGAGIIRPYYAV
ncbi:MAG: tsaB [Alphaproteobacteria bacterium]|nr:tsaB [Alphaproteobacteria bacterium]